MVSWVVYIYTFKRSAIITLSIYNICRRNAAVHATPQGGAHELHVPAEATVSPRIRTGYRTRQSHRLSFFHLVNYPHCIGCQHQSQLSRGWENGRLALLARSAGFSNRCKWPAIVRQSVKNLWELCIAAMEDSSDRRGRMMVCILSMAPADGQKGWWKALPRVTEFPPFHEGFWASSLVLHHRRISMFSRVPDIVRDSLALWRSRCWWSPKWWDDRQWGRFPRPRTI